MRGATCVSACVGVSCVSCVSHKNRRDKKGQGEIYLVIVLSKSMAAMADASKDIRCRLPVRGSAEAAGRLPVLRFLGRDKAADKSSQTVSSSTVCDSEPVFFGTVTSM